MKGRLFGIILVLILVGTSAKSQPVLEKFLGISFRQMVSKDDILVGLAVSPPVTGKKLYGFMVFDFRPYRKKLRVQQTANFFNQYAENRYMIGIGAGYQQALINDTFGLYLQLSSHYTWGNYGGTEIQPPSEFLFVPDAGVFFGGKRATTVRLGYAYQRATSELRAVKSLSEHKISISLTLDI
jgi:hypothetical protein